jgi:transposase
VLSYPGNASINVMGAVSLEENPKWHFKIVPVFDCWTFRAFLEQIIRRHKGKKVFMILDNARYHHAKDVRWWLEYNKDKIELFFIPPYSPELNAIECVWKKTRQLSTHNRYFEKIEGLTFTLSRRFNKYQGNPKSLRNIIAPFLN